MTKKYECIKFIRGLTIGAVYSEEAVSPNPFNALVTNDEGHLQYVPRNINFKVLEVEESETMVLG